MHECKKKLQDMENINILKISNLQKSTKNHININKNKNVLN